MLGEDYTIDMYVVSQFPGDVIDYGAFLHRLPWTNQTIIYANLVNAYVYNYNHFFYYFVIGSKLEKLVSNSNTALLIQTMTLSRLHAPSIVKSCTPVSLEIALPWYSSQVQQPGGIPIDVSWSNHLLYKGQNAERLELVKMQRDPAPASMLRHVRDNCHGKCDKITCSCREKGLVYSLEWYHCKGITYNNAAVNTGVECGKQWTDESILMTVIIY